MPDLTVRANDKCVIGLPACGYQFNSTRSCFIAYGFDTSGLELAVIRSLLKDRNFEVVEAGGDLAPGSYAFCTKICSKIITSRFCIVLLNNDIVDGSMRPNANVNMEYGLMLGHNKFIVPFQLDSQSLPFNVAGLDTIKYNTSNFSTRAGRAIDEAIRATEPQSISQNLIDQSLSTFLLSEGAIVATINDAGDKAFFDLGNACGFNLLTDFSGNCPIYFGNFPALRGDLVAWRLEKLVRLLSERLDALPERRQLAAVTDEQFAWLLQVRSRIMIWLLVAGDRDRDRVKALQVPFPVRIFTISDVWRFIDSLLGSAPAEEPSDRGGHGP